MLLWQQNGGIMKILLVAVNAKYIHSNLAVYSLRAYARKYASNIGLLELTINHPEEDILEAIYKEKAEVVAFSCYIWNIGIITRVAEELKKVQPEVQIWFGGPEVSYDANKCLTDLKALEGIIIGEGEQTFLELMEYYVEHKKERSEINGLAYKERGNLIITQPRQPLPLDVIPFPYENMEEFRNRIIYYESSRGCPFSCSYCLSSIDKRVRLRDTELVKKELKLFLDCQVPQVKFVDRTFNCNKRHAMEIWNFIKENDNGVTNFHFEISADLLEEDELELLSSLRPGQVQFEIGVQSTNSDTIEAIHRRMDFNKLSRNVIKIREGKNIHQHLDLIAGLPHEGYKAFEQSFNDVYRLRPDQLQLGFLKILKGSLMEEEAQSYGITFRNNPPYEVLFTKDLSYDELLKIKGICEMLEVYYNSTQFTYSIKYLEHFYESPLMLYRSLSEFYENRGYQSLSHSRIKRYEILLDFYKEMMIESKGGKETEKSINLFQEILLLDSFLREHMKTRPAFAPAVMDHNSLRELYIKNQTGRRDIHIEQFQFDVLMSAETGNIVLKKTTLLFDYDLRDTLSKAARITLVDF
jgi:radical SAM superfamily enzyme YgiQ (UPF0313 family)